MRFFRKQYAVFLNDLMNQGFRVYSVEKSSTEIRIFKDKKGHLSFLCNSSLQFI